MNPATVMMGICAGIVTGLSLFGLLLAATVDGGAINMAVGCGIVAPFGWLLFWMMRKLD